MPLAICRDGNIIPNSVFDQECQLRGRRSPAQVSNRLNDELRLIALDEVSTLFSDPKLPLR